MTRKYDLGVSHAGIKWEMERVANTGHIGSDWAVTSHQNVDGILDANHAMATHNDGYTADKTFRRVGSIPLALIQYWKQVEGWDAFDPDHADKLAQKLNDIDFWKLRTAPGQVTAKGGGGLR